MDEIQKILVNAGRKDLAQKYYKKVVGAFNDDDYATLKNLQDELLEIWKILQKDGRPQAKDLTNFKMEIEKTLNEEKYNQRYIKKIEDKILLWLNKELSLGHRYDDKVVRKLKRLKDIVS